MTQQDAVNAHDRTLQALELRKAGFTYSVIAEKLGYNSKSAAWDAVNRALKHLKREPAEGVLALELERLDALYKSMYPQALKGNLGAVDRCLKISERRAKLLGLDAPVKNDVSGDLRVVVVYDQDGNGTLEATAPAAEGDSA